MTTSAAPLPLTPKYACFRLGGRDFLIRYEKPLLSVYRRDATGWSPLRAEEQVEESQIASRWSLATSLGELAQVHDNTGVQALQIQNCTEKVPHLLLVTTPHTLYLAFSDPIEDSSPLWEVLPIYGDPTKEEEKYIHELPFRLMWRLFTTEDAGLTP